MDSDRKKYNSMEPLLQKINKGFISLTEQDKKRNNEILKSLIIQITEKMREVDSLFAEMYNKNIFYGGSFYDGLKVAHPDEYDLDLLLTLPSPLKFKLKEATNVPGFVLLEFSDYTPSMEKLDLQGKHKGMDKLCNNNHYLDTSKVLQWIQSVVQLAMNKFKKDGNFYILETPNGNFRAKISKSGPAFTLKATGLVENKQVNMDVDLVPCFLFPKDHWPQGAFRKNPADQKPNFFIVPKQLKGMPNSDHYWRLSFQEQERVLLDSKSTLKPSIKLLKKMRDFLQHKTISSYYIKTVALWTIDEKEPIFWNNSLSYVFMTILKNYQKCLEAGSIPYYWNKNYNLLKGVSKETLTNINNKITAIINDIERNLGDPLVVGKYLVSAKELLALKNQYGIQ